MSAERRRRSELTDAMEREVKRLHALLPSDPDEARTYLAALFAGWGIPHDPDVKKARASQREMAERYTLTWWLIENAVKAGQVLTPRGCAYAAETLALPKTEEAFRLIEEATLALRDSYLVPWDALRDGRRRAIRHSRWSNIPSLLTYYAQRYTRDLWADAPVVPQIWIEKQGVADALEDFGEVVGINIYPGAGFSGAGFTTKPLRRLPAIADRSSSSNSWTRTRPGSGWETRPGVGW